MPAKTELTDQVTEIKKPCNHESPDQENVVKFKNRMLKWPNPVEYVNNMYGSHPDDDNEYFRVIFAK